MKFFTAFVRPTSIHHGYDEKNNLIVSSFPQREFVEKLIRVDRVLSITEEYIYIECPAGVAQTWEYKGTLAEIKAMFASADLTIP